MRGFKDYDRPKECETPYILRVVEERRLDDVAGTNEPVEGGEARSAVMGWNSRGGIVYSGHDGWVLRERQRAIGGFPYIM